MAVYAVLEPPRRADGQPVAAERFRFVRDGFNWGAFVFGPFWMLAHRLWLALAAYLVIMTALALVCAATGVTDGGRLFAAGLVALLVGLEAGTLRRWTLVRGGWRDHGIVVADDLEAAEQRFFSAWVASAGNHTPHDGLFGMSPTAGASR